MDHNETWHWAKNFGQVHRCKDSTPDIYTHVKKVMTYLYSSIFFKEIAVPILGILKTAASTFQKYINVLLLFFLL